MFSPSVRTHRDHRPTLSESNLQLCGCTFAAAQIASFAGATALGRCRSGFAFATQTHAVGMMGSRAGVHRISCDHPAVLHASEQLHCNDAFVQHVSEGFWFFSFERTLYFVQYFMLRCTLLCWAFGLWFMFYSWHSNGQNKCSYY